MKEKYSKEAILNRLARLEGQVRGVRRMIEEDKPCEDILIQLSAVHSALEGSTKLVLTGYMETCLEEGLESDKCKKEVLNRLADLMLQTKF